MIRLINSTRLQLLIIAFLTVISYSNIFQNTYFGDDQVFLIDWKEADNLSSIPKLFTEGAIPVSERATYRPLRSTIIVLLHQFTGTNPLGFHLYSLLMLLSSSFFVYLIIQKLTDKRSIIFITTLLFALHPVHTEAITFMLGSIDSTGALFLLISFYLYLRSKETKKVFFLSIFFAILAFFTNEITLILPLLIIFYDLTFNNLSTKKLFIIKNLKSYLPYLLSAAFFVLIRTVVVGLNSKGTYLEDSFYLTMLVMVKGFIKYISLLIWPVNLSPYPQIATGIESYTGSDAPADKIRSLSILDFDILFYLALFLGSIYLAFKNRRRILLVSFAIGWFFISLLPVSNIIPLNATIQERYLYLASFSYCLLIGWLFNFLYELKSIRYGLIIIIISYAGFFVYQTHQRNEEWRTPITYWSKTVSQVPNFFWANVFYANSLANAGEYNQALIYYQKALEIRPDSPGIMANIARIYQLKGMNH